MMDTYVNVMQLITLVLEALGVITILIGVALATVRYLRQPRPFSSHRACVEYRHDIGRSTLLGLDLLIAGDIIKTVIVHQTGASVLVLGMVVLIRTLLGVTLHLEAEGRWPWQPDPRTRAGRWLTALISATRGVGGGARGAAQRLAARRGRDDSRREIGIRQWRAVLNKELIVGGANGIVLALTCGLGVYLWSGSFDLALDRLEV